MEQIDIIRTPERKQWLLDNYRTCRLHIKEIIAILNTMPGRQITKDVQVVNFANKLDLRREGSCIKGGRGFHIVEYEVWNKARKDWLIEHWLDPVTMEAMLKHINAIPGDKPVGSAKAIQYQAKRLSLPDRTSVGRQVQKARAKEAASIREAEKPRVWTPERCTYLRELWLQMVAVRQMKAMIEEKYPGRPISSFDAVKRQAHTMGLPQRTSDINRQLISIAVKKSIQEPVWTPERNRTLQELWSCTLTIRQIKDILEQKHPGKPISSIDAVKKRAFVMGLGSRNPEISRHLMTVGAKERVRLQAENPRPKPVIRAQVYQPVERKEQKPEFADNAVNKRLDKARKMLMAKKDPFDVHLAAGIPLREVYRLSAELRGRI